MNAIVNEERQQARLGVNAIVNGQRQQARLGVNAIVNGEPKKIEDKDAEREMHQFT